MNKNESVRAIRILAKSMFKNLKNEGLGSCEIVRFTTELMELMAKDDSPTLVSARSRHDDE